MKIGFAKIKNTAKANILFVRGTHNAANMKIPARNEPIDTKPIANCASKIGRIINGCANPAAIKPTPSNNPTIGKLNKINAKSSAITAVKCNTPNRTAHVAYTSTDNQRTNTFGALIPIVAKALMNTTKNAITIITIPTKMRSGILRINAGITNAALMKINPNNHLAAVSAANATKEATKLNPNGKINDPNLNKLIIPNANNVVIIGAASAKRLIPMNNQLIGLSQFVNMPMNE